MLLLVGCRGCRPTTPAPDAGTDAGAPLPAVPLTVRYPDGGSLEVTAEARAFLEVRERPGVVAEQWRPVAALAGITSALLLAHPLDEVRLSFSPSAQGDAEQASAAAAVAAMAVLAGHPLNDGGTELRGVLLPDGTLAEEGTLRELHGQRTGAGLKVPAALTPDAMRLPQGLEVAFAALGSRWREEATGLEARLPRKSRAEVTAALDLAQRAQGVAQLERSRDALRLARLAAGAGDPAEVVARWQRARTQFESLPVPSPAAAGQLLETARRLARSWVLLQGEGGAGEADLLLDEVEAWSTGVQHLSAAPTATPQRLAAVARAWLSAGRFSAADGPLGLELAASLLAGPAPSPAASLLALAAAQDAYLFAQAARLAEVPVTEGDLELRRAAGRARRAVGLPPGVAYDWALAGEADAAEARLLRWRATTTAHLLLQLAPSPGLLQ